MKERLTTYITELVDVYFGGKTVSDLVSEYCKKKPVTIKSCKVVDCRATAKNDKCVKMTVYAKRSGTYTITANGQAILPVSLNAGSNSLTIDSPVGGNVTLSIKGYNTSCTVTLPTREEEEYPPEVVTLPADNITTAGARIRAEVKKINDDSCQVWLVYGTSTDLTKSTSKTTLTSPQTAGATLSGLKAGTQYFFMAKASNSHGTSEGIVRTFTTKEPQVCIKSCKVVSCPAGISGDKCVQVTASVNVAGTWYLYANDTKLQSFNFTEANKDYTFVAGVEGLTGELTLEFKKS